MGTLLSFRNWVLFSVLWAAFVGILAWSGWPRLPLDTGTDAATQGLLRAATRDHVLLHGGLAAMAPLVLLAVGWMVGRARRTSQ